MARQLPIKLVDDTAMYASEAKIYPREIDGRFQRLRLIAVWVLLGLFYAAPWMNWSGRQAVLFDLPARKFHVLGLSFWPQDFVFLAMLLMIAAFALFFFTAIAGRLWCGYACPQTVWTEVFIAMERWCEGDRGRRIKLDAAPWSREKILRKGAKHTLWLLFALWTGFTFVGFFTPIRTLAAEVGTLTLGGWEIFWILFYALATWGNAGFLREQVCKYMCPYARFQGAMFDRNTLIIAYDSERGEGRGPRRKGVPSVLATVESAQRATLGDCIDCTICVQVCPTGIDIRDGLQYECIACGACVDACDSVMDKIGYPRGLVRYATLNDIEHQPTRVLRPRVVVYALILTTLLVAFTWSVLHRTPLLVDVLRDRNALYRELADGAIENAYTVKLVNKEHVVRHYRISVTGAPALTISNNAADVIVTAENTANVPITLHAPAGSISGMHDIVFEVAAIGGDSRRSHKSRFIAPSGATP